MKIRMSRLLIFSVFVAGIFAGGCTAISIPEQATASERAEFTNSIRENGPGKIVVGIVKTSAIKPKLKNHRGAEYWESTNYTDNIKMILNASKVFAEVDYTDKLKKSPDLLLVDHARLYDTYAENFVVNVVFSFITLGIIPVFNERIRGFEFTLENPKTGGKMNFKLVESRTEASGWIPAIFIMFPGWETGPKDDMEIRSESIYRFYLQLIRKRKEMEKLATNSKD